MANNMNKNKLWSDSLTRDSLTTYAEGLACDNFERGKKCHIRRNDQNSWLVLKDCAGTLKVDSRESGTLLYDRVRHVVIDSDGFMSCSCGKVQMYLMPYQHICAIISQKNIMYLQCFISDGTRCTIIITVIVLVLSWLLIQQLLSMKS